MLNIRMRPRKIEKNKIQTMIMARKVLGELKMIG